MEEPLWHHMRKLDGQIIIKNGEYLSWFKQLPEGWQSLLKKLDKEISSYVRDTNIYVIDAKEKYGTLSIILKNTLSDIDNELEEILSKYEKLSQHTCMSCGNKVKDNPFLLPLCEKCR